MWEWLGFGQTPDLSRARWLGRALGILLVLLGAAIVAGGLGALAQFLGYALTWPDDRTATPAHEAMRNIGLILVALFGAPFVVWRSLVAQQQADTAEQGHITDQINKAVEALGATRAGKASLRRITFELNGHTQTIVSANLLTGHLDLPEGAENVQLHEHSVAELVEPNREVRIGGIYALERIAQDSLRDHVQIMEILTAYIRENAPAKGLAPLVPALDRLLDDATAEARAAHVKAVRRRAERLRYAANALTADTVIQAAIQVIARREKRQKDEEKADTRYGKNGYRLDLRGTNLRAVDISSGDLSRARLDGAHLEGARLFEAQLEGARLGGAHLEGADLRQAHLERARLVGAHLERANLAGAHLERAGLREAHLVGAGLVGAQLEGAVLVWAHLEGANLIGALLEGANFTGAVVQYAAVKSCDLSKTRLDQDQVNATFGDGSVTDARLPPGVTRPAHWPAADLDVNGFFEEMRKWQADPEGYTPP
mgnify:CR=1 FL=1